MKKWKLPQFCLFIILCIALNFAGSQIAFRWNIPLWLDSLGTMLCAYVAGPVIGSMVGITGNLVSAITSGDIPYYALTSVTLAVILGYCARKNMMETWIGAMAVSVFISLASVVISVPLNILLYDGWTGNVWGNGVISRLVEIGSPLILAQIAGQFYLEFVDKVVCMFILFLLIKLVRRHYQQQEKTETENAVKIIPFLLIFSLFGSQSAEAQTEIPVTGTNYNNYVQTVYSSENGLPCGEANDIEQTNDGILWIGTYAGLYRYNGSEFRWMDDYDSVRNVNCLYVDAEGRLWIGTNDNGLTIVINEKISSVIDQSMGLPTNSVRSIIQSADGYYYIGTTGSLQVLSLNNGYKVVNTLREVYDADRIAADAAGHVAAVTNNGRLFLMRGGKILSSRQIANGEEIFRSCTFAPNGKLLAGTSRGKIYIFDISGGYFREQAVLETGTLSYLKDLNYLENGDLFVSADNGIGYFDINGNFRVINTNEFSNSIDNMLIDYQGNLWFSSSRLGLLRLAPSSFLNIYTTMGLEHKVVNAVAFWKGEYYFGTDNGLDIVNDDLTEQVHNKLTEQLKNVRIRCMLVDSKNSLWICTYGGGLLEIEADGTQHVYSSSNVIFGNRARVVYELSDGTILAGSDMGLSFIRNHQIDETLSNAHGAINTMILTVTELPDGRILVGTDGSGLAVLENHEITKILTRADGLSSEVILRTVYDKKGQGVFVITSNGLCYMDLDGTVRLLNNFPYYNNYNVYINETSDQLFVMSSAGIYVAQREEVVSDEAAYQNELLDARRGLDSSLVANSWYYINEAGELYLPTDSGVYMLNSNSYSDATHVYRMSVASVRVNNEEGTIDRNKTIIVPRNATRLEIIPEIINYSVQIPYVGFYLEGFDDDWRTMPLDALRPAVYTNLPVGEYVFHLGVLDNDRQTILTQRAYDVIKTKEIYDNPWFTAYLVVVPLVAAIWFTTYIVRNRNERMMAIQRAKLALSQQQVEMSNNTIIAIAKAVDAKDERTSQHSWRVSEYSVMIARAMGMNETDIENLRRAALVHDIGKIGIADAILNKDSRLTDEEYAIMKSHTSRGAEILHDLTFIPHVLDGALYHHERIDGRGYPQGLKGDEIPLFARIIGVADAFDAMTANRVYRKQMDLGYVLGEMERGRGKQFDPEVDDILLRLLKDGTIDLKKLYPSLAETPETTPEAEKADEGGAA